MTHTLRLSQPAPNDLPRGLVITTRYAGPTDHNGSRIIATCKRDDETTIRSVVSYGYIGSVLDEHYNAALRCLAKIEAQNDRFSFRIQAVGSTATGYHFLTEAVDRDPV